MAEKGLKRRVGNWTLANQLTFLRLVAVPLFILAVLDARFDVAFWLFVGAGVTDLLDGIIARTFGQSTPLGAYLDPAADKALLVSSFVLLTQYPQLFQTIPMTVRIPIWLTILMISRDVFIVAIALMLYLAYGQTRFRPSFLGKVTTGCELVTVGAVLLSNWLGRGLEIVRWSAFLTLAMILVSGLHYLWRTVHKVRAEGPDRESA